MTQQNGELDPRRSALLLMDFQRGIVDGLTGAQSLLPTVAEAADHARTAGMPVIYVRVAFRSGAPEVSSHNPIFAALAGSDQMHEDAEATQLHPDLAPSEGDVVIVKRRVGALSTTDLDTVLRAQGIDTLVLSGIATSGVVLSTVRDAADRDYRLKVLSDGVADSDTEVHRLLVEKVFPRQAEVLSCADFASRL